MQNKNYIVETVGKPKFSHLSKITAKMFYKTLLLQIEKYYNEQKKGDKL